MNEVVETFRNSQSTLLTALDGHDSDAIFQASKELSKAAVQLNSIDTDSLDSSILPLISEVDELMQASIYRLRFLRDHSSTRLQLLSGWRENQAETYSNGTYRR